MQISQNQYQILVYNSEIWPENQLAYTKSNCIGFSFGGFGWPAPPSEGVCQIYHNLLYLKPLFNFLHVLKINKDILSTFGALHLRTEIIEFEYCCKMVKNRCKSAKTSTKYWSIILEFGHKINWRTLNLIA